MRNSISRYIFLNFKITFLSNMAIGPRIIMQERGTRVTPETEVKKFQRATDRLQLSTSCEAPVLRADVDLILVTEHP